MSKMWRGPSADLKRAMNDPSWPVLHRRNAGFGVFCDAANETSTFYAIEKDRGDWVRRELGRMSGPDPMLNCLHGSHKFTVTDGPLIGLHGDYLVRCGEELTSLGRDIVKQVDQATTEIEDLIASVRA